MPAPCPPALLGASSARRQGTPGAWGGIAEVEALSIAPLTKFLYFLKILLDTLACLCYISLQKGDFGMTTACAIQELTERERFIVEQVSRGASVRKISHECSWVPDEVREFLESKRAMEYMAQLESEKEERRLQLQEKMQFGKGVAVEVLSDIVAGAFDAHPKERLRAAAEILDRDPEQQFTKKGQVNVDVRHVHSVEEDSGRVMRALTEAMGLSADEVQRRIGGEEVIDVTPEVKREADEPRTWREKNEAGEWYRPPRIPKSEQEYEPDMRVSPEAPESMYKRSRGIEGGIPVEQGAGYGDW